MRLKKILITFLMLGFISNSFAPGFSAAENRMSEEIAVSLVIDTSGSMAETDPNNLRKTAADIFVDLLSPEDYLGLISFSTDVTEIAPMQRIGDVTNKQAIKDTLAPIVNVDGNTNYQLALHAAERQLDSFTEKDVQKVIIFLTDGVPEPDYGKREDAAFMSAYMDTLWQTTAQIGLKNYPIYALGFGTADQTVLQRIASDTGGEAKFIGSPSEIAVNYFDVLRTLKNRQAFLNEIFDVAEGNSIPFQIDKYTSQVTLVVKNDTPGAEIVVRSKIVEDFSDEVVIQKNENYTVITMNQEKDELAGEWELLVTGTGAIQVFGDKDLFLNARLMEPTANTQHPVNEPLEIAAAINGDLSEQMTVEALISKNGTPDAKPLILEKKGDLYYVSYTEVNQIGTYKIDIGIKDQNVLVTNATADIVVQELPVLKTDFYNAGNIYKVTESQKVTGYLEMRGNRVTGSQDVSINNFTLVQNYSDGRQEFYPLFDNQDEASGDILAGDGLFTTIVPFQAEGDMTTFLVVEGIYRGEAFTLKKIVGQHMVVSYGEIIGKLPETLLIGRPGGKVAIPVHLENHSGRSETVFLDVQSELGTLVKNEIILQPNEIYAGEVTLDIAKDVSVATHDLQITLAAKDPLTSIQSNMDGKVKILSGMSLFLKRTKDFFIANGSWLGFILMLPILFVFIGRILYAVFVEKKMDRPGYLFYRKLINNDAFEERNTFIFPKESPRVIISLGKDNPNADLNIGDAESECNLVFTVTETKQKWKSIAGYRAFLKSDSPYNIMLESLAPSIFQMYDEIYIKKEIFDKDTFLAGGYEFHYQATAQEYVQEDSAKNLLEGKW